MKKIILTLVISLVMSVGVLEYAFAEASVTATLNPKYPSPRSSVTITLSSYSFNINTAMIVWKVDGKKVLEGEGEKVLTLKTGDVGDTSTVVVTASTADGFEVTQSINITPSSVVLLYEAPKSYVPLLYEGRSLPGEGALVRVSAIPSMSDSGQTASPATLSYSWYLNDTLVRSVSGLGKQAALIRLDYLQTKNVIKAIVRSPYGNSAEKTITVYPHAVMPLLYTYDTILGPNFTSLIGLRFEAIKDFTLSLEPFYVSDDFTKPASYVWYLDGLPSTPLGGRILALHPKENSYGSKMLSIDVFGSDRRLQKGTTKVELIFDTRK